MGEGSDNGQGQARQVTGWVNPSRTREHGTDDKPQEATADLAWRGDLPARSGHGAIQVPVNPAPGVQDRFYGGGQGSS